ncbi:hypothetical protein OOU_Y34scaffold00090g5 [Pyricularia oryzae Y34]|uniref:F-box domain-containing protein n=1 Tax=Pyricularia oryzae (strain Y34) TaxID=1143189 RepID=A0AA97P980_PYRO3|nr:hypothetical protein OOU_Y34scaffold00090g5 [Pyricularia oryzae Y34]
MPTMPCSLLSLPLELAAQIARASIPDGIEGLALTCKQLRAAAEPLLAEHYRRKRRFRRFRFPLTHDVHTQFLAPGTRASNPADPDPASRATGIRIHKTIDLIRAILVNPVAGDYILEADLRGEPSFNNPDYRDLDDDLKLPLDPSRSSSFPRIEDHDRDLFRTALCESAYLQHANQDPDHWLEQLTNTCTGHAEVFLLTLLPRVKLLYPPVHWGYIGRANQSPELENVWAVLDAIVNRANDKSLPAKDASLSQLERIGPTLLPSYELYCALIPFEPFLGLDSVRTFHGSGFKFIDDRYTGNRFHPRYKRYSQNLDTLELLACVTRRPELSALLERCASAGLKKFRFSYETKWHGCGHNWDAGDFLDVVCRHVGRTLEELSVTRISGFRGWGDIGTTMTDMRTGFPSLKILELDVRMMMGPARTEEVVAAYSKKAYGPWPPRECANVPPARPRLIDLLPPQLETFRLFCSMLEQDDLDCIKALISELRAERAASLPRLQEMGFYYYQTDNIKKPQVQQTLSEVQDAGFSMHPNEKEHSWEYKAVNPKWVNDSKEMFFSNYTT